MLFDDFEQRERFEQAWQAVGIARPVRQSLFTFGDSVLSYYLVCGDPGKMKATIVRGEVKVKRPSLITPENAQGDFRNFFDNDDQRGVAEFLLSRTARFSSMQFENNRGEMKSVDDRMDEAVARLNQQLDDDDEEQVAILTAPPELGGMAVLRYTAERVWQSAPDNLQELRERGFLP